MQIWHITVTWYVCMMHNPENSGIWSIAALNWIRLTNLSVDVGKLVLLLTGVENVDNFTPWISTFGVFESQWTWYILSTTFFVHLWRSFTASFPKSTRMYCLFQYYWIFLQCFYCFSHDVLLLARQTFWVFPMCKSCCYHCWHRLLWSYWIIMVWKQSL